jgi:flagellar basal body-associated protein FliL
VAHFFFVDSRKKLLWAIAVLLVVLLGLGVVLEFFWFLLNF